MNRRRRLLALCLPLVLVGCAQAAPAASPATSATSATSAPTSSPTATDIPDDVEPVSLGSPSTVADAGIKACGVRKYEQQVQGIGIVAHARLLPHYIALTGREPEIQSDEPVLAVQFGGTIQLGIRGGPGSAGFVDIENATCVAFDGSPTWYNTGPWVDENGNRGTPEPAPFMDRSLPAPLP